MERSLRCGCFIKLLRPLRVTAREPYTNTTDGSTYHLRSVLWTAIDVFNLVVRCKGRHELAKQTAETHPGMTVRTPEPKQVLRPTLGSARSRLRVKRRGAASSKLGDLLTHQAAIPQGQLGPGHHRSE